jgi:hypothetical protein
VSGYAETVTAWAQHLRTGGTLSWEEFSTEHTNMECAPADQRHHESLPTATQLRLLQLLLPRMVHTEELADLIFATPAPGRGLVDIPLTWPTENPFGTPAHSPEDVPAAELLRQAIAVLAAILERAPSEPLAPEAKRPLPLPWRQRFMVHGAPIAADVVRQDLTRQRHHQTDFQAVHLILGNPLDVMMAELWDQRVKGGGIVKWRSLWQQIANEDQLPQQLDLAAQARTLKANGEQVVIVVGYDTESAHALAVDHLGRRPMVPAPPLNPAATDALRRINRLIQQTRGSDALSALRPRLAKLLTFPDREPLGVPSEALAWANEQANRQVQQLREGGYPVVGDLDLIQPATDHPRRMRADRTLPVVLAAIRQAWKELPWPSV